MAKKQAKALPVGAIKDLRFLIDGKVHELDEVKPGVYWLRQISEEPGQKKRKYIQVKDVKALSFTDTAYVYELDEARRGEFILRTLRKV